MINPNSLIIVGNILQRIDMQNKMSPCTVVLTKRKSFEVSQDGYVFEVTDFAKTKCCPVPLTEKILIDSGFEFYYENKFGKQFELKTGSNRFYVVINDEKNTFAIQLEFAPINNIRCHETQFVHNLQNAYRLATEEDLEIVINA